MVGEFPLLVTSPSVFLATNTTFGGFIVRPTVPPIRRVRMWIKYAAVGPGGMTVEAETDWRWLGATVRPSSLPIDDDWFIISGTDFVNPASSNPGLLRVSVVRLQITEGPSSRIGLLVHCSDTVVCAYAARPSAMSFGVNLTTGRVVAEESCRYGIVTTITDPKSLATVSGCGSMMGIVTAVFQLLTNATNSLPERWRGQSYMGGVGCSISAPTATSFCKAGGANISVPLPWSTDPSLSFVLQMNATAVGILASAPVCGSNGTRRWERTCPLPRACREPSIMTAEASTTSDRVCTCPAWFVGYPVCRQVQRCNFSHGQYAVQSETWTSDAVCRNISVYCKQHWDAIVMPATPTSDMECVTPALTVAAKTMAGATDDDVPAGGSPATGGVVGISGDNTLGVTQITIATTMVGVLLLTVTAICVHRHRRKLAAALLRRSLARGVDPQASSRHRSRGAAGGSPRARARYDDIAESTDADR